MVYDLQMSYYIHVSFIVGKSCVGRHRVRVRMGYYTIPHLGLFIISTSVYSHEYHCRSIGHSMDTVRHQGTKVTGSKQSSTVE